MYKIPSSHGKTRIGSIYINLGSDGDQWIISPTKNGGVVITHVPPREPVTAELRSVTSVLVAAGKISEQQVSAHFRSPENSGKEVMEAIAMLSKEQEG